MDLSIPVPCTLSVPSAMRLALPIQPKTTYGEWNAVLCPLFPTNSFYGLASAGFYLPVGCWVTAARAHPKVTLVALVTRSSNKAARDQSQRCYFYTQLVFELCSIHG